jgi:hypothetical protein
LQVVSLTVEAVEAAAAAEVLHDWLWHIRVASGLVEVEVVAEAEEAVLRAVKLYHS